MDPQLLYPAAGIAVVAVSALVFALRRRRQPEWMTTILSASPADSSRRIGLRPSHARR
ncbi:MAG TPA: hypothetical protein VMJ10_34325 [Kofleriaceae bacterium]|nr:hypothetical protein [Kofleriaceae bacterium]